ncbi:Aste57867_13598 [Aphanomyces stellatus]|uniref:Aste57867_13598 protein n=1 Tax=Aphanomyces stellatus TaxID=120398 RepID=A0A485KZ95_9STRA|nr:hypothetical protein As57867_013548 [Aphanomyces stellatus]VFT90435.1 Aste57867_13598 [Aphanomyces stellatus]
MAEQLDVDQVTKAVVALKQFLKKKQSQNSKQSLVDEQNVIQVIFTRNTVPPKEQLKAIPIALPHNIRGDGEACLFVKDSDKERIKTHLKEDPVAGLAKVMPIKKLKKNFSQFKDKRELSSAYGVFLVDDRVLPYVKSLLGKTFFDKKKQPTTVNVSGKKNISDHIRRVLAGTEMFISPGPCFNVKIAHDGMTNDEIVENIVQGTKNILAHVPKKWKNIKSINIKTSDSVALPIYNALPNSAKLPLEVAKKRKVDEDSEPVAAEPATKKAKTDDKTKKVASPKTTPVEAEKKTTTPVKKDTKKEEESTPVKKAATPVKKGAAAKKAAPEKKEAAPAKKAAAAPAKKVAAAKKAAPAKKEAVPAAKKAVAAKPTKKAPAKKVAASKK